MYGWAVVQAVGEVKNPKIMLFCFVLFFDHFLFMQEKDQRSLDINTAKCMLGLLLGKTWSLFPVFHQFLEVRSLKQNYFFFLICLFWYFN